jgi:hypothetical protein
MSWKAKTVIMFLRRKWGRGVLGSIYAAGPVRKSGYQSPEDL